MATAHINPNYGFSVQWLRLGDLQLFRATREPKLHDQDTMGQHLFELPTGQVQLYIRDRGGNLLI